MSAAAHDPLSEDGAEGSSGLALCPPCVSDLPEQADPVLQALADIDLFVSVGAESFDVTVLQEVFPGVEKESVEYRRSVAPELLREYVKECLPFWNSEPLSLIVYPRLPEGGGRRLLCLDDLDEGKLQKVRHLAFRVVRTSPGNFHAWLALDGVDDIVISRLKKSLGTDKGASGHGRVAGSLNVKRLHLEKFGAYPMVEVIDQTPGLLADIEDVRPLLGRDDVRKVRRARRWAEPSRDRLPSYEEFCANRPEGKSASETDWAWVKTAEACGCDPGEVAEVLGYHVMNSGRRKSKDYVSRTVAKAFGRAA